MHTKCAKKMKQKKKKRKKKEEEKIVCTYTTGSWFQQEMKTQINNLQAHLEGRGLNDASSSEEGDGRRAIVLQVAVELILGGIVVNIQKLLGLRGVVVMLGTLRFTEAEDVDALADAEGNQDSLHAGRVMEGEFLVADDIPPACAVVVVCHKGCDGVPLCNPVAEVVKLRIGDQQRRSL